MQVNSNCANNSMLDSFGLFAAFRHGQIIRQIKALTNFA
jgi:hypothetical protein